MKFIKDLSPRSVPTNALHRAIFTHLGYADEGFFL